MLKTPVLIENAPHLIESLIILSTKQEQSHQPSSDPPARESQLTLSGLMLLSHCETQMTLNLLPNREVVITPQGGTVSSAGVTGTLTLSGIFHCCMNTTTLTTIENAADFLTQFRRLPRYVQDLVRPHLNQPQQTALKILDCCSELDAVLTADIAAIAQLNKETTRQVLSTLDGKLVTAEDTAQGKAWKLRT